MGILSRYIQRQISVPSLLGLVVVTFVMVAGEIRERIDEMPVAQFTLRDFGLLSGLLMPTLVSYVIPVTFLMGILMCFGRLAQQNEIVAMKAAGISMKRMAVQVIVLGALLSGACFLLQDRAQPWAYTRLSRLIYTELPKRVGMIYTLTPGVMHEVGDWWIYFGAKDAENATLYNIEILRSEGRDEWLYQAKKAHVALDAGGPRVTLEQGSFIIPTQGARGAFDKMELALPKISGHYVRSARRALSLTELLALERFLSLAHAMNKRGLWDPSMVDDVETAGGIVGDVTAIPESFKAHLPPGYRVDTDWLAPLREPGKDIKDELRKARQEISSRFYLPLMCLAVGFVAAPLGARAKRSGKSYSFAVGFLIILAAYVLITVLEPRSLHSLTHVVLRGLIPDFVLVAAGVFFLWRVDRV